MGLPVLLALMLPPGIWATDRIEPVRMDPGQELLSAVRLLAGADRRFSGFFERDLRYARAMRRHFKRSGTHPAVEAYLRLARRGFGEESGYWLMSLLGPPPGLEPPADYPNDLSARAGGREALEELRAALAAFAREADFQGFWEGSAKLRAEMVADVQAEVESLDIHGRLKSYTGLGGEGDFELLPAPFAPAVAAATFFSTMPRGTPLVTILFGPTEARRGRPVFHVDRLLGSIWQKLAQEQLSGAARAHRAAFEGIPRLKQAEGGEAWFLSIQSEIALAVAGRLYAKTPNGWSVEEWPVKYARLGMPRLGALMERLKEYEGARERYPTLADFYPRLVDAIRETAGARTPFRGGLRDLLGERGEVGVILPEGADRDLLLAAVRARWPAAREGELPDRPLVVLGRAEDNAWLRENWPRLRLPVRLGPAGAELRRESEREPQIFPGAVDLVSVAVHPADPARAVLLYCAPPRRLPALVALDPGVWDFVLYDGAVPVKSGSYERSRIPWRVR